MKDLGLLGPQHTYHDLARARFTPNLSYQFFDTFDEVFRALNKGVIKKGLVAIHNNASGKVSNNLERIKNEGYKLIEQFDFPIHLCLGSIRPISIQKIRKIYSHPMAIKETQKFFSKYTHITFIASTSTSGAIEELKNAQKEDVAVISSKEAIEASNLSLVHQNIEDHPNNTTTFSLIEGDSKENG